VQEGHATSFHSDQYSSILEVEREFVASSTEASLCCKGRKGQNHYCSYLQQVQVVRACWCGGIYPGSYSEGVGFESQQRHWVLLGLSLHFKVPPPKGQDSNPIWPVALTSNSLLRLMTEFAVQHTIIFPAIYNSSSPYHQSLYNSDINKKLKKWSYPCTRPWRPIWLWEVEDPTLSRQSSYTSRWRQCCQSYAKAALYPRNIFFCFRYSFLLEAE
jgi:hypothetical protein